MNLNTPAGRDDQCDYAQRASRLPGPVDPNLDHARIDLDIRVGMYRAQHMLRVFEKRVYDLFMQNLVQGTAHLSIGMEAVAAGFGAAMRRDDYTFASYRGHAHTLVRGVPLPRVMAELLGRGTGVVGGKGGSMHLTSVEHGVMGSYAIIGSQLCIANGAAWSAQIRGTDQVAVCFFGDGTTNIGTFHEALNMAAIWKLPTVFVCENNLYMEYTPIDLVTSVPHPAADRAASYGLRGVLVDGNDADAVHVAAREAIERAREGGGPSLVEAVTYRHGGHSRADLGKYRPAEEVDAWLARDPIPMYHDRLIRLGVSEAVLHEIQLEVTAAVDEATEFAKRSEPPRGDVLLSQVWSDGGSSWRN